MSSRMREKKKNNNAFHQRSTTTTMTDNFSVEVNLTGESFVYPKELSSQESSPIISSPTQNPTPTPVSSSSSVGIISPISPIRNGLLPSSPPNNNNNNNTSTTFFKPIVDSSSSSSRFHQSVSSSSEVSFVESPIINPKSKRHGLSGDEKILPYRIASPPPPDTAWASSTPPYDDYDNSILDNVVTRTSQLKNNHYNNNSSDGLTSSSISRPLNNNNNSESYLDNCCQRNTINKSPPSTTTTTTRTHHHHQETSTRHNNNNKNNNNNFPSFINSPKNMSKFFVKEEEEEEMKPPVKLKLTKLNSLEKISSNNKKKNDLLLPDLSHKHTTHATHHDDDEEEEGEEETRNLSSVGSSSQHDDIDNFYLNHDREEEEEDDNDDDDDDKKDHEQAAQVNQEDSTSLLDIFDFFTMTDTSTSSSSPQPQDNTNNNNTSTTTTTTTSDKTNETSSSKKQSYNISFNEEKQEQGENSLRRKTRLKRTNKKFRSEGKISVAPRRKNSRFKTTPKMIAKILKINCQKENLKSYEELENNNYIMNQNQNQHEQSSFTQQRRGEETGTSTSTSSGVFMNTIVHGTPPFSSSSDTGNEKYSNNNNNNNTTPSSHHHHNQFFSSSSSSCVVHEIRRGAWTWCTEWSPDGTRLAIGSENLPLAILDVTSKPMMKVLYNARFYLSPLKKFSVRSLAWSHSNKFIAVGGTGDVVTILDSDTYQIVHTIKGTGYVGCLHWRNNTSSRINNNNNILAIGSRLDKAFFVNISSSGKQSSSVVDSNVIETLKLDDWVNAIQFSPHGGLVSIGDNTGRTTVFSYNDNDSSSTSSKVTLITDYIMDGPILFVEWSSDGKWLFMGGEDFSVSIVNTHTWNLVNALCRKKWVHFTSCCNFNSGSGDSKYIAVGGQKSKVSILEMESWKETCSYDAKNGELVLTSKWHPKNEFITLAGQDHTVKIFTVQNNAHYSNGDGGATNIADENLLRFSSGILSFGVSPDGKYYALGKEDGIVSFIQKRGEATNEQPNNEKSSSSNNNNNNKMMNERANNNNSGVTIAYELVAPFEPGVPIIQKKLSIEWSPDGTMVAIGGNNTVILLDASSSSHTSSDHQQQQKDDSYPIIYPQFRILHIIRDLKDVESISFSPNNNSLVIGAKITKMFDISQKENIRFQSDITREDSTASSAFSADGIFLALIGKTHQKLAIFDAKSQQSQSQSHSHQQQSIEDQKIVWRAMFELDCGSKCTALCWGPHVSKRLHYLAFGGGGGGDDTNKEGKGGKDDTNKVTIIEIQKSMQMYAWNAVMHFPCRSKIILLEWRYDGILSIGLKDGSINVVDLSYLRSGKAVNEMDYKWQRQGITSSMTIEPRRPSSSSLSQNKNKNKAQQTKNNQKDNTNLVLTSMRWLGPRATSDHVLVTGGSDGILETITLNRKEGAG